MRRKRTPTVGTPLGSHATVVQPFRFQWRSAYPVKILSGTLHDLPCVVANYGGLRSMVVGRPMGTMIGVHRGLEPAPILAAEEADWLYVVSYGSWRCTIRWGNGATAYVTPAALEDLKRRHRWRDLPNAREPL